MQVNDLERQAIKTNYKQIQRALQQISKIVLLVYIWTKRFDNFLKYKRTKIKTACKTGIYICTRCIKRTDQPMQPLKFKLPVEIKVI